MIQPNSAAIGFTNWLLNISKQHLSGPQRVIVTEVYNAAVGAYPISEQTWYNFNLFSAWRNRFYEVYRDYATQTFPDLLTNLLLAINFDGNSDNLVDSVPSVDTAITYGVPFGKINEGAFFDGVTSNIMTEHLSVGSVFTVNMWINRSVTASGFNILIGGISSNIFYMLGGGTGFRWETSLANNNVSFTVNPSQWYMVTLKQDGTDVWIYVDGIVIAMFPGQAVPASFDFLGSFSGGSQYTGSMDILAIWDRELTDAEILENYNAGVGIQYPF